MDILVKLISKAINLIRGLCFLLDGIYKAAGFLMILQTSRKIFIARFMQYPCLKGLQTF